MLEDYAWPGNVRELRNVIERATIMAAGRLIELGDLPPLGRALPAAAGGERLEPGMTVDDAERRLIMLTLEHTGNNKTRAAELLGISLKTLHNKLNRFRLDDAGSGELGHAPQPQGPAGGRRHLDRRRSRSIVLGGLYVTGVARVRLEESRARGRFLANAIYHRTREVAAASADPYAALRADPGLRSILESCVYSPNVTYAAIVDAADVVDRAQRREPGGAAPARRARASTRCWMPARGASCGRSTPTMGGRSRSSSRC